MAYRPFFDGTLIGPNVPSFANPAGKYPSLVGQKPCLLPVSSSRSSDLVIPRLLRSTGHCLSFSLSSPPSLRSGFARREDGSHLPSSPFILNFLTSNLVKIFRVTGRSSTVARPGLCRSSLVTEEDTEVESFNRDEGGGGRSGDDGGGDGGDGGGGDAINWISGALFFAVWIGLIVYTWTWSPNQTPYRDIYFIEKLLFLHRDDGFVMNNVLVAEWYSMVCWPIIYASLLIPSGRSRKNGVKVGPFVAASFFVGAFALLPYFGLWRPPPPSVDRDELSQFPLSVLESKITAVVVTVAGVVLAVYAGLAGSADWTEFSQYLKESRFIHIMTIDFVTLATSAPFWVYNDFTARRGSDRASWLLALSLIPVLGPALYTILRSGLPSTSVKDSQDN